MEFKDSRTQQNLLAAFSGESMARNKYLFFADKARQEGNDEVAALFEQMAKNEGVHGRLLYQKLKGVGDSSQNLQDAIQGEYGEWSSMYPSFAKIAREEGFEDIATLFEQIAKIEKDHELSFLTALSKLANKKSNVPQQKKLETVNVKGYRCMFCGAVFEERPDVCEVCQAIGSFEEVTLQKRVE